ncbi:hypothetical protein G7Z17_g525 [Cylindrodendrum hubeiense]|uniref:Uncharacterized protein n=1 Tax=Cylindrodendrum hubeiense TaxID=595255 RepID=A0A9P5HPL4_9HYPO|nr:hypothetical protein G7Z17_g525 [Cylindrodendrum hubeiense]
MAQAVNIPWPNFVAFNGRLTTATFQTWQNYFLPLTVLYAWAVYLAYIQFVGAPLLVRPNIEAVPRMTCVMYLQRQDNSLPPYFFLGHTKARATNAPDEFATDERDNSLCLDYRAQMVFNAAQFGNPPLPEAARIWDERMRETLFEVLPGVTAPLLPVEDFRQEVFAGMANDPIIQNLLQALIPIVPPGFPGPVDNLKDLQKLLVAVAQVSWANAGTPMAWPSPSNMASTLRLKRPLTQEGMETAINDLINAQIAGQNDQQLAPLWIRLIKLYIIPLIFVPPSIPPNPTFEAGKYAPHAPGMVVLVNALAVGLHTAYSVRLNIKLRRVVQLCRGHRTPGLNSAQEIALEQKWITKFRRNVTEDYGRCAETYPASAISELFWNGPDAYNTADEGPKIRGFALQTQVIGKGAAELRLLDQVFDTNQLDQMSNDLLVSAYRLPCAQFCRRMLPVVQMRTTPQELDDYDDDLVNHVAKTVVLPPY